MKGLLSPAAMSAATFIFYTFTAALLFAGDDTACRLAVQETPLNFSDTQFDSKPERNKLLIQHIVNPTESTRNAVLEAFLPEVRYMARSIHKRLPDEIDEEDLVQAGIFGLMEALDNFDTERGVKFGTYAAPKIRSRILDHLREQDWVPRLVRSRSAQVRKAVEAYKKEHGREPSYEELAELLGLDLKTEAGRKEYQRLLEDGQSVTSTVSSDRSRDNPNVDGARTLFELADTDSSNDPLSQNIRRGLKEYITKNLSRAERLVVVLYYYEGMTMKEIGQVLDMSESRVSQMHSSIMARLKAQGAKLASELSAD